MILWTGEGSTEIYFMENWKDRLKLFNQKFIEVHIYVCSQTFAGNVENALMDETWPLLLTLKEYMMMKSGPHLPQVEKALAQKRRPNTAINK